MFFIYLHHTHIYTHTPPRSNAGIDPFFKRDVVSEEITGACACAWSPCRHYLFVCLFEVGKGKERFAFALLLLCYSRTRITGVLVLTEGRGGDVRDVYFLGGRIGLVVVKSVYHIE